MNLGYIDLTIDYSNSRPGAGKTFDATKRMATRKAKYLYSVDRMEVFPERRRLIQSASHSKNLIITELNCDLSDNVRQDLKDAPSVHAYDDHVVVICTHEALMTSDLSQYSGWHLIIDEVPNAWMHTEMSTKASKIQLGKYFSIKKSRGKDYYKITVKEGVDIDAIRNDTYFKDMVTLYKSAKNGIAYTATKKFSDTWDWWTIWNFKELKIFKSGRIVGNAFEESLTFKLMQAHGIKMNKFVIPEFAAYKHRKLTIEYFDENNRATAYFFNTPIGRDALKAVGKYLRAYPVDIWSCNNAKPRVNYEKLIGLQKGKLSPCVAGSNSYATCSSAAYIFTAKPGKTERGRLAEMGIEFEDVVRSREIEPMIQFATRLSIRDPENDADNTFYVYDKTQAMEVKEFFDNLAIGINTELKFINLGVPRVSKSINAKKAAKSALNRAAYQRKKTAKGKV